MRWDYISFLFHDYYYFIMIDTQCCVVLAEAIIIEKYYTECLLQNAVPHDIQPNLYDW